MEKNEIHKKSNTPSEELFPWHSLSVSEVIDKLNTNATLGLSKDQARERLLKYGPNQLVASARILPIELFFSQFKNSLIIILLAAAVFSGILWHIVEAITIGVIILFSVILGFIQELRASRALEVLSKLASPTALVFRNGFETEIFARDLVPGDIIIISTGDRFPADARLIKKINLKADEALLTGESLSVEKQSDVIVTRNAPLGDRVNMVFAGTSCIYGRGIAVVTITGMQTEFGRIACMLKNVSQEETPLEKNLDSLVKWLTKFAFIVVAIIVILGIWRGQPLLEMVIFGIALAVAVVPEALPAVVTISLAIGVQRMIRRNALVRHLPAVETLGCTSIICSDKTGTITKDEMTVKNIFVDGKVIMVGGSGYEPVGEFLFDNAPYPFTEAFRLLLQSAVLASDARVLEKDGVWHINGDPTEGALI